MKQQHGVATRALVQGEFFNHRRARALVTAASAFLLGVAFAGIAAAQTAPIGLPDKSHPESVTSTSDGTLYIASFNLGGVIKVAPAGKAEPFVAPGANGSRSLLGISADEKGGVLYACSNDMTGLGVHGPGATKGAWLKTF